MSAKVINFPYRQKAANNVNRAATKGADEPTAPNMVLPTADQLKAWDKKVLDFVFTTMFTDLKINIQNCSQEPDDSSMLVESLHALFARAVGIWHPLHPVTSKYFNPPDIGNTASNGIVQPRCSKCDAIFYSETDEVSHKCRVL